MGWLFFTRDRQVGILPGKDAAFEIVDLLEAGLFQLLAGRRRLGARSAADDNRLVFVFVERTDLIVEAVAGNVDGIDDVAFVKICRRPHIHNHRLLVIDHFGGRCRIYRPLVAQRQGVDQIGCDQNKGCHKDPVVHREFDELLHSVPLEKGDFLQGESVYQEAGRVKS